jgi:hypothetical protein
MYKNNLFVYMKFTKCCNFFKIFVGCVEILRESENLNMQENRSELFKLYYKKMYMSKFITEDIRKSIIKDVNMYSN